MKGFLLKVACFFAILLVIDWIVGLTFSRLSEQAKGGYTGHYHYLVNKTNEDVLVFGSSRAIHHYNPQIISDSLGMSCYNCGQDGNGIVLFYGWWKLISQRYHPKVLIYDLTNDFDLLVKDDNHLFLGWLKEVYDRPGVKEIFHAVDSTERVKMMSQMYRYNSKWHQMLADCIYPLYVVSDNGFLPLEGEIDPMRIKKDYDINKPYQFDSLKLYFLRKLVCEMGPTKLIFVVSPTIYGQNEEQLEPVKAICSEYNIPLYDFSNAPKYVHKTKYFKDGCHLNAFGADEFTSELMGILKKSNSIK